MEDGTGLPNADSYASIAAADAYLDKYGYTSWSSLDDEAKAVALRRGTQYVDLTYGSKWRGERLKGREQALDWPRTGVVDCDGVDVPSNAVPQEVVYATMEAALRESQNPGVLLPSVAATAIQKRVQIGQLEVEWFDPRSGGGGSSGVGVSIPVVNNLVAGLLTDCGASLSGGLGMAWLSRA